MKINKQLIIFLFILAVGVIGYSIIPSFEREEFNAELVEDISSGNITTTTLETTENEIKPTIQNFSKIKLKENMEINEI